MTDPVSTTGSAGLGPGRVQPDNQSLLFQAAVKQAKAKAWSFGWSGSLHEEKTSDQHYTSDVNVGGLNIGSEAEFGFWKFKTANHLELFAMTAKAKGNVDELKPVGFGGTGEFSERIGVLEAGVSGTFDPRHLDLGGEVKAGAIIGDITAKGQGSVYPSRWVEGLCKLMAGKDSKVPVVAHACDDVSKNDYGFSYSREIGGTMGLAVTASGHVGLKDGKFDIGARFGFSPSVGPIAGASAQFGRFPR